MEISTEVDFDITCNECGRSLDISGENFNARKGTISFTVQPCQHCLNNAEDKGYVKGQDG